MLQIFGVRPIVKEQKWSPSHPPKYTPDYYYNVTLGPHSGVLCDFQKNLNKYTVYQSSGSLRIQVE